MRAKEYLKKYEYFSIKRKNLIEERRDLVEDMAAVSGINYDRDIVQTSKDSDQIYRIHERIEKRAEVIDKILESIDRARPEIVDRVNSIPDPRFSRLLFLRYIRYHKFEEIANEMGYQPQTINVLHGRALQMFEKMYHNELNIKENQ